MNNLLTVREIRSLFHPILPEQPRSTPSIVLYNYGVCILYDITASSKPRPLLQKSARLMQIETFLHCAYYLRPVLGEW